MSAFLCVDFGSTFTKAALVDGETGALLGSVSSPTTLGTDVIDGLEACRTALEHQGAEEAEVLACSSAGGGLRIAVVGTEELVTAEAGRRVALSSGGKVVLVLAGRLDDGRVAELRAAAPDVVLLVGGTDGGNSEVLESDAHMLAAAGWSGPVVVAGNREARAEVQAALGPAGTPYVLADNVVPRIGTLAPDSARRAIREMFLSHVIGGKQLSAHGAFTAMVRGATPDVVLTGVEVLAAELGVDVVVVDVGGATSDVHSVVRLDREDAGLGREVVASTPATRTVEGDLGVRWSALSTWQAAYDARLMPEHACADAQRRHDDPGYLPGSETDRRFDEELATAAGLLALRRHAGRAQVVVGPGGRVVERTGTDLRDVGLLVGSGGVLRHGGPGAATRLLHRLLGPSPEGWQLPERPRCVVDHDYVLAAIGLLADRRPRAAGALARSLAT